MDVCLKVLIYLFYLYSTFQKKVTKCFTEYPKKERNIQPYLHSDMTKKSQGTLHVEQVQTALMMPVVPIESKHWGGILAWQGSLSDPCQAHNQGWLVSRQNQRLGGHQNTPLCSTGYILHVILVSISVTIYIIFNSSGLIFSKINYCFSFLSASPSLQTCAHWRKKVGCIFLPFPQGGQSAESLNAPLPPSASDNSSVFSGADDANMDLEHSPSCQTTSRSDVRLYGLCC